MSLRHEQRIVAESPRALLVCEQPALAHPLKDTSDLARLCECEDAMEAASSGLCFKMGGHFL